MADTSWTDDSARDWKRGQQDPSRDEMLGKALSDDEIQILSGALPRYKSLIAQAKASVGTKVYGQDSFLDDVITAMIAGGNTRAVGVPGLAKTVAMQHIAQVTALDYKQIKFTADMMPSDVTGSNIWVRDESGHGGDFVFKPGPVFAQLLFADEINRASAKTQSALLEAMQEMAVTVDGVTRYLPNPFMVLAAQNPDGQAGTYELTEAQLDRFIINLNIGYPDAEAERRIMVQTTGPRHDMADLHRRSKLPGEEGDLTKPFNRASVLPPVFDRNDLILMQNDARHLYLPKKVVDSTIQIVRGLRPEESSSAFIKRYVEWGPGPRAYQAFALVAKARALQRGEMAPNVGDILAIARPVLEHRMKLSFEAVADKVTFDQVLQEVTKDLVLDARRTAPATLRR